MNTVIPEFVKRVDFEKRSLLRECWRLWLGCIDAHGIFKTLPQNFAKVEGGSYTYGRAVFGASQSSVRAICCTAQKRLTMTALGHIRMLITKSTAC